MTISDESLMTDADFQFFKQFLKQHSGYVLQEEKRYLLESRLRKILTLEKLDSVAGLIRKLNSGPNDALARRFIEAMTINETHFFRDKKLFDSLVNVVLPELAAAGRKHVSIWSAASSSGQEAYSLAMLLEEHKARLGMEYQIHATDLHSRMVERAKTGFYNAFEVSRGLTEQHLERYFSKVEGGWQVRPEVRSHIIFSQRNLKEPFSGLGPFDMVFLRNVLIYFDDELKSDILTRIYPLLRTPGYLALGGTESISMLTHSFPRFAENTGFYKKTVPI